MASFFQSHLDGKIRVLLGLDADAVDAYVNEKSEEFLMELQDKGIEIPAAIRNHVIVALQNALHRTIQGE